MKNYSSKTIFDNESKKEIVRKIIRLFVVKRKYSRFLGFLESSKSDEIVWDELLNDTRNFKPECLIELKGIEHTKERILINLQNHGAKDKAYLMSTDDELTGEIGNLKEILDMADIECLVYCLDSRVAYYIGHSADHFLLKAD